MNSESKVLGSDVVSPKTTSSSFQVLRKHAEGGLGVVHVARDVTLGRDVALKRVRSQHQGRESSQWRFMLEAQVTGGLEHPGIVPVYSLESLDDGTQQYAMRFIHGTSLRDAIDQLHGHETQRRQRESEASFSGSSAKRDDSLGVEAPCEPSPTMRALLGRFVDVCQAIGYANARGVLHRDIKPDNVMLGRFGETLVVDWGLAKVTGKGEMPLVIQADGSQFASCVENRDGPRLGDESRMTDPVVPASVETRDVPDSEQGLDETVDAPREGSTGAESMDRTVETGPTPDPKPRAFNARDVSPTVEGSIIGTPAFMSPEQARGDGKAMSPASDVYSLGATLYHLITGRPPHTGRSVSILESVQVGEFVPPRIVDPRIEKPLAAICEKAMAQDPPDRYESATELAADVERYLADEPVTAHRDSILTQAFRAARRHRAWTISGMAALLLVSVTASSAALIVNHFRAENERIALDNRRIADANAEIAAEKTALASSETEARQQEAAARQVAERQKRVALRTMTSTLFEIEEKLKDIPGNNPIRRRMLTTILTGLKKVEMDVAADQPDLRDTIARHRSLTLRELVLLAMRTGEFGSAPIVATPNLTDESESEAVAEDDADGRTAFDRYCMSRASTALAISERVHKDRPNNAMALRDLSISVELMAKVHDRAYRHDEAVQFAQRSVELAEQLLEIDPKSEKYVVDLNQALIASALYARRAGDSVSSQRSLQRSIDVLENFVKQNDETDQVLRQLACSCGELSETLAPEDRPQAIELAERATNLFRERFHRQPDSRRNAADLFLMLLKQGDLFLEPLDIERAMPAYEEASEISAAMIRLAPNDAEIISDIASVFERRAMLHTQKDEPDEARRLYAEAFPYREKLLSIDPSRSVARVNVLRCLFRLASLTQELGDEKAAISLFRRVEQIAEPMVVDGEHPESIKSYVDYAKEFLEPQ
ncbi:MAG: serine/threonine-protein kinase [Planctomycetota bacterium]